MTISNFGLNLTSLSVFLLFLHYLNSSFSQKICPNCGKVICPLSTNPNCRDSNYKVRCDEHSQKLYVDALYRSSYHIIRITASSQRLMVQPVPWLNDTCVTQEAPKSGGICLNQTLPFNISSSNTIFLFYCSPRLVISSLNCTSSSLCHRYLDSSGHIDRAHALKCASGPNLCCTFVAGGLPSTYKLRLHTSGCQVFRSILHFDPKKAASQWEEGLGIQWAPPPEPLCKSIADYSRSSTCSAKGGAGSCCCLCNKNYYWNHSLGTSSMKKKEPLRSGLAIKVSIGLGACIIVCVLTGAIIYRKSRRFSGLIKLAKAREGMLKSSCGEKCARIYSIKKVKKATKVGNTKGTEQVLNEVRILSQVNHKNLGLLGCCVEGEQPLLIDEHISNRTLHDHLQGKYSTFLDWKTRIKISLQTAKTLAYLHPSAYTPIYHRDIKPTNILLDDDFNARVADFGRSRLACPGLSHVFACAQGTLGYLDPEYRNYQLTEKSDVYSYEVVLLKLLTSQKAIDFSEIKMTGIWSFT